MVKRIAISMISGFAAALAAIGSNEIGDLQWSARASKAKWLKCEGQAVSRSEYASLYSAIGTTFGVGDGSTTFNLPDGRGRVLIGSGDAVAGQTSARLLGAKGGAETHVLTATEMPSHRHKLLGNGSYSGTVATGLGDGGSRSVAGNQTTTANAYVDANNGAALIENTGGGGAHNNMQPFSVANLFIFTGV